MKIILPGSIKSKKNSKIATIVGGVHCPKRAIIIPSKAYSAWEKEARKSVMLQLPFTFAPLDGALHVRAIAYIRGPAPDLSGMTESVGDALQGLIYVNDKQIVSWDGSRVLKDKDNPRTEVDIELYWKEVTQWSG